MFLVCFSVISPSSFENIKQKWIPVLKNHFMFLFPLFTFQSRINLQEVRHHGPKSAPIVLVGTKSDMRADADVARQLAAQGADFVSVSKAQELAASIGARAYIECVFVSSS